MRVAGAGRGRSSVECWVCRDRGRRGSKPQAASSRLSSASTELIERKFSGVKYYRITGAVDLSEKQPYDRQAALHKAVEHAANFVFFREKQVEWLTGSMGGRPPVIVAPVTPPRRGRGWMIFAIILLVLLGISMLGNFSGLVGNMSALDTLREAEESSQRFLRGHVKNE